MRKNLIFFENLIFCQKKYRISAHNRMCLRALFVVCAIAAFPDLHYGAIIFISPTFGRYVQTTCYSF